MKKLSEVKASIDAFGCNAEKVKELLIKANLVEDDSASEAFYPGARVKVTGDPIDGAWLRGQVGTVVRDSNGNEGIRFLIEFDKTHPSLHSGDSSGTARKSRSCWNINKSELSIIQRERM